MGVMHWDPFRDLAAIHDRMNRLFETALSGSDYGDAQDGVGSWSPASDILETDGSIRVCCEVPGLSREAIDIKLENNVLTISGERRLAAAPNASSYHRVERSYGPFQRSFAVPGGIDPEGIAASYREGVLTVVLPKRPESTARRISVRVS